jgi:hypothetical protein
MGKYHIRKLSYTSLKEEVMWDYKGTYKFDIGAGYGELEYDFFTINNDEDFSSLIDYYRAIWKRFDYFLDQHRITKDNKGLSPMVILAMKTHRANLCLTFRDEVEDILKIRTMVVNREMSNGSYDTISFDFFRFVTDNALSHLKKGGVSSNWLL